MKNKEDLYEEFYSVISCLLAEGVEFMLPDDLYYAIKEEWEKYNKLLLHKDKINKLNKERLKNETNI